MLFEADPDLDQDLDPDLDQDLHKKWTARRNLLYWLRTHI